MTDRNERKAQPDSSHTSAFHRSFAVWALERLGQKGNPGHPTRPTTKHCPTSCTTALLKGLVESMVHRVNSHARGRGHGGSADPATRSALQAWALLPGKRYKQDGTRRTCCPSHVSLRGLRFSFKLEMSVYGTFQIQLGHFTKCIKLIGISQSIIFLYLFHSIKEWKIQSYLHRDASNKIEGNWYFQIKMSQKSDFQWIQKYVY